MSLKTISVLRWFKDGSNKSYKINIYEDDNIEDGIIKIVMNIKNQEKKDLERFYVWNNNYKSILFSIENIKWKGYNFNPLKSIDKTNQSIKDPIIYNFNKGLCYFNKINIIFELDFPELKNNQYYFTEKKISSNDLFINTQKKLDELYKTDLKPILDSHIIIHRYELKTKLKEELFLANIYDKLNTSPLIQYISWINDTYTLIHKLYLYHNITHSHLKNWTNIEKINNNNCINCYSLLSNSNSYAKITIENNMNISINYILDLRKTINWEIIDKHLDLLKSYLQSTFTQKLVFTPISVKIHNYFTVNNVSFDNLNKKISSYPQIFNLISSKDTINLIYKRSSNFSNEAFDFSKYIKTRILLGIDNDEIKEELLTFGLNADDAKKMIEDEINLIQEMEDKLIKEDFTDRKLNTIVIIKRNKNGFEIITHNIPNKNEFTYLINWLSKIISLSQSNEIEMKKKVPKKIKLPTPPETPKSSSKSSEEELENLSSSDDEIYGGGREDKNERYKIDLLKQTDKDLFDDNYARQKCQKRNQPFVISSETRQKLIDENRYNVDNDIYYGSKKDKMNYYICPSLWCKISKVPTDKDGKCPIANEETILSFFDNPNEEGVKRYAKLIKPDENNMCVPCCGKKPPKQEELNRCKNYETYNPNVKINIDEKDENYLVNYPAPIEVGRYGIVPQNLHNFLFPSIKYQSCSKDLTKSEKCLVRKGINHKKIVNNELSTDIYPDSLIYALTYLLDFDTKNDFINDIKNKLDLLTFLSIENGNVCKAFMDKLPLIPNENIELIKELQEHFFKFPSINKLYNIDLKKFNYELSRLLAIYKSYKKFIDYISTNNYHIPKSPYYFYSLISNIYNKLLIVWEKEPKSNITQIVCPYFTSYNDLINSLEINPDVIMLLKEKKYFEPLELKTKGKNPIKLFTFNDYPNLQSLINECSTHNIYNYNKDIYTKLYSVNNWIKAKGNGLDNYQKFIIDTIIINSDLTIEHFLTKGNILISIPQIGINFINRLIKDFDIKNIVFYEDLSNINKIYNINIRVKDLNLFKNKIQEISNDIKYDIGELDKSIEQGDKVNEVYTILQIKKKNLSNNSIIHTRIEDDLYFYEKNNYEDNKLWFQLQMMVFSTLLKKLDNDLLTKFQSMKRIDYINEMIKLIDNYKTNPHKNKIRLILEEIPIYSINHIKNYLNKLIIYYKYDFLNPVININKKQFQFSQIALNNGIPHELLNYHKSSPYNNFFHTKYDNKEFGFNTTIQKEDLNLLPELLKGTPTKLNSKWTMHKKSKWYHMEIIFVNEYNKESFKLFFEWFSNFIKINTSFANLQELTNNKLLIIKDDLDNLQFLLNEDKLLFSYFKKFSQKSYSSVNEYMDKAYSQLNKSETNSIIHKIINKGIPLNYLYLLSMSEILNINILIIHRAIYKTSKDELVRGDLDDFIISTTLFKASVNHYNRPLLIFHKRINNITNETIFELVLDTTNPINSKSIYLKLNETPQEILILIEEHLKKYK